MALHLYRGETSDIENIKVTCRIDLSSGEGLSYSEYGESISLESKVNSRKSI